MNVKTIEKQIAVNASAKQVWEVLVNGELNPLWYAIFSEGVVADTTWNEGGRVSFRSLNGSGITGIVVANTPFELLSICFDGVIENDIANFDSPAAAEVKDAREIYRLTESDGITNLHIESDMNPEMFESMAGLWDQALLKIKELAEAGAA